MIGHASAEDTKLLGGGGVNFGNARSSNCWNCIEIVNPTVITLFCIILNILRSNQVDLSGSSTSPPPPTHTHPAYGPALKED